MPNCEKCHEEIQDGALPEFHGKILCEDCYIDAVAPNMPKAHYKNDAEFMNRLKDSYPVHKQPYH